MAEPIPLDIEPRDPRKELVSRLEDAPAEHAEALLALYEVIQGLHDRGVLEMARGALGSTDELLEIGVAAAKTPGAIRGIRNLLVLVQMLGEIDPETLKRVTRAIPPALEAAASPTEPLGALALLGRLRNEDTRRGVTALQAILETFGRELQTESPGLRGPTPTAKGETLV